MAQVKYGSIITEIKGKVGGTTFQGGRTGGLMKNKGKVFVRGWDRVPIGAGSSGTTQIANFSKVTKYWSQITTEQRNSWSGLVGIWTFVNKFGDTYNGSSYQIFCAANINRLSLGLTMLASAPVFNAAFDPDWSFTDYSIAGDFQQTIGNAAAVGQNVFNQLSFFTSPTKSLNKTRIIGSDTNTILGTGTTSVKAIIQGAFGGNPPLGSIFYITKWFCWADYPKAQFYTVYKINVVA